MDLLIIFIILVVVVVIVVAILFSGHKKAIMSNLSQNDPLVGTWEAMGPPELVNNFDLKTNVSKFGEEYLINIQTVSKNNQEEGSIVVKGKPVIEGNVYTFTSENGDKSVVTLDNRRLTLKNPNGMEIIAEKV